MQKLEFPMGERVLSLERGRVARQSDSAVWVQCGDTIVLVSVVAAAKEQSGFDFFPLTVDYREQVCAAGKFPGGFFKREGRPTEREILISRLIDRSIRPLFPESFRREIQVISLVLSADHEHDPGILSVIGASAALSSSRIPALGPVGAVRIGLVDNRIVINPTYDEVDRSTLDLILTGTENAPIMMEGSGREVAEEKFLEAVSVGAGKIREMIAVLKTWHSEKDAIPVRDVPQMREKAASFLEGRLESVRSFPEKKDRERYYREMEEEFLSPWAEDEKAQAGESFRKVLEEKLRHMILSSGVRLDGRDSRQVRPIECSVGLLPRNHGSALFTRGQTQCLASVTLGTRSDEQIIDGLLEESTKRFMLHYNFPPFCVGEVKMMRGPSRREIGHGALAERSLAALMPPEDVFSYTVRIVANILESNGSSSMATVCAGSLALLDAGVPLGRPIGGVAMGIIKEGDRHIILTDIAGEEDHCGDLDLKIAGTTEGITGFQMDVKSPELTYEILGEALQQGREARLHILGKMSEVLPQARPEISRFAPKIVKFVIKQDKIGLVIGPGGKNIRKIIEETGVKIDIEDDGEVQISCSDAEACRQAEERIRSMVEEPEVGQVYDGVVSRIFPFGAMVRLSCGEGLVHVSELAPYRVNRVEDIARVGEPMKVKVVEIDEQGRVNLSRKQALSAEEAEQERKAHPDLPSSDGPRPDGPRRGSQPRRPGGPRYPRSGGDRPRPSR